MNMMILWWCLYDSIGTDIWSCGINWSLSKISYYLILKSWPTKNAKRSKLESPLLELHNPMLSC
jgi:hypothetical protein